MTERRFKFTWSRTWSDRKQDYVAADCERQIGRVYRIAGVDERWKWTMTAFYLALGIGDGESAASFAFSRQMVIKSTAGSSVPRQRFRQVKERPKQFSHRHAVRKPVFLNRRREPLNIYCVGRPDIRSRSFGRLFHVGLVNGS